VAGQLCHPHITEEPQLLLNGDDGFQGGGMRDVTSALPLSHASLQPALPALSRRFSPFPIIFPKEKPPYSLTPFVL
jgi:hypothetical protein